MHKYLEHAKPSYSVRGYPPAHLVEDSSVIAQGEELQVRVTVTFGGQELGLREWDGSGQEAQGGL